MKIGTWNITYLTEKECELEEKAIKYGINIIGLCETKKKGHGSMRLGNNHSLYYSGRVRTERGKEG